MVTVIVDYDPAKERRVSIHAFLDAEEKETETCLRELKRAHPKREIVLLQATTWAELRYSHRKFFFPVHQNR